jgi:class 3 adenylate cyclase
MATNRFWKKFGKYSVVFIISFLVFLFVAGFYYYMDEGAVFKIKEKFQAFETSSINLRFKVKSILEGKNSSVPLALTNYGKKDVYNQFVIAAVDDASIRSFGVSYPLDRKVYADLLNHFNSLPKESMPSLVFFDIIFAEPSQRPESDKALIEAFSNYSSLVGEDIILDVFSTKINITEDSKIRKTLYENESLNYDSQRVQAMKRFELNLNQKLKKTMNFPRVAPVMADISKSLGFLGSANIDHGQGVVLKKPMVVRASYFLTNNNNFTITNVYYPSVVLAMAVKLFHSDISNLVFEKNQVTIKNAVYNGQKTDFIIPVDDRWRLSINYESSPQSGYVRIVPLKDIAHTELVKNAFVFVGMYSKSMALDKWASPLGEMFGIEHNAYVLGTLLKRNFITEVPEWIDILYLFLISMLIGWMVSRGTRSTIVATALFFIIPLALGISLFLFNIQIVTFLPLLSGVLILVAVQIYVLLTEQKEKKFIHSTFSSYLNPKLVDILIQNPERIQLGGEDKEVTVFFSATKGLESIKDNVDAKELISYLNSYFSKMADIVINTSGTLDKYIGDCVMAFWGAPVDLPDHALKACQASVKTIEALQEFNAEQAKKGYKPIKINIGINTGNIIVGNVGSEQQKNYTAIGDAVNLASRLKGLNKFFHTNIVLSEFTYELVKNNVIARELDLTKVKGKNKPVRIYELLDIK